MELNQKIFAILESSDIVWPRYGVETIGELTEKIMRAVEKDREGEAD